jgi:BASS family bile acid:Na+ symporter
LKIIRILNQQWLVLLLAFVLALLAGDLAKYIKPLVMPVVIAVMVLSAASFNPSDLRPFSKSIRQGTEGFIYSYIILSGMVLLLSYVFVKDVDLRIGFVMVAVSPPGVAIIPFTYLMRGRIVYSAIGTFGAFVASIVVGPIIAALFIGSGAVESGKMAFLLAEVIVLPFIIARILMKTSVFRRVLLFRGPLINWGMFLVIFTSVGLNSRTFYEHPGMVGSSALVSILSIFGTGFLVEWISKTFGVSRETRVPVLLMSTIKNGGFAVVAAMALAGERASAAAAVFSGFTAIFLVYLSVRDKLKPF